MKTKFLTFFILSLLLTVGLSNCSNKEYDPEDYVSSLLSGEYKKDGLWKLYVTENGTPMDDYGYVRFDSKYLQEADFIFVNVIPGETNKEFKNIPLSDTEKGMEFTIEYSKNSKPITITGIVSFGEMTVDIKD